MRKFTADHDLALFRQLLERCHAPLEPGDQRVMLRAGAFEAEVRFRVRPHQSESALRSEREGVLNFLRAAPHRVRTCGCDTKRKSLLFSDARRPCQKPVVGVVVRRYGSAERVYLPVCTTHAAKPIDAHFVALVSLTKKEIASFRADADHRARVLLHEDRAARGECIRCGRRHDDPSDKRARACAPCAALPASVRL